MRTKGVFAIAAAAVIAGAYLTGYFAERRVRIAAEAEVRALQTRLATAEARVRLGELLGQALIVKEVAMRQNYGQARELSSPFFDSVRNETARAADARLRDGLSEVLAMRDAVTAGLAKADPTVVDTLHGIELRLRLALGYALSPEPASSPR